MKSKRNLFLMYGISLLQGMIFYGPIATLYRKAAGVSVFQITLIESISLALCIMLEMPWGIVADKMGYRKTMIINCLIYVVSKVVFWRAHGFGGFLLERVMLSVVMAGLSGCDVSLLYLSCREGESHRVFGIYSALNTVGLLLAALVYSAVIGERYRLAGFLTVLTYGAAALLSFGLVEPPRRARVEKREGGAAENGGNGNFRKYLLEVVRDWRFLLLLIGMAFLAETNQTITVFLSQLQYEKCGIIPADMGYIYILVTTAGMAGIWSSKLTGRLGVRPCTFLLFGMGGGACLVMAFTDSAFLSVAGVVVLCMAAGLFLPLQTELQNRHVKAADRATILSIYAVIMEGTGIFTNLLFGRAATASLSFAMGSGTVLCLLGAVFFQIWYGHKKMPLA